MSCCNFCTNIHSKNNAGSDEETNLFIKIWNWVKENVQYFLLGIGVCQFLSGIYLLAIHKKTDDFTIMLACLFSSGLSHSSLAGVDIKKFKFSCIYIIPIIFIIYILTINTFTLNEILSSKLDARLTLIIILEAGIVTLWAVAITYKLSQSFYIKIEESNKPRKRFRPLLPRHNDDEQILDVN